MKDFTVYEFSERLNAMTELLKQAEGWGDAYDSSTGQTLIQLMVHATDELHYMLQRRTQENYLETASLRSSIIARACELGYRFKRAAANSGYIIVTLDRPATSDVIIPSLTVLTLNGVEYITAEQAVIGIGQMSTSLYVKQASLTSLTLSTDVNNLITIEDYEYIDNDLFKVSESGVEYQDIRRQLDVNKRALSFLTSTDKFYDIKYTTKGMCVVFGDGVFGYKPTTPINISFVIANQDQEPLNTLDNVFEFAEDFLTDINLNQYSYTATNTTKITGFTQPETDFNIKKNAPDYHKTNNRAQTNSDYEYWVKNVPGVQIVDSKAFGETEINDIVYNLNNVFITYLKSDGTDLTVIEKRAILDYMDTVKTSQAHIILTNAKKLYIQALLELRRNPRLTISDSELYDLVRRYMLDYFKLQDGSIGREFQASDFIRDLYKQTVTRNGIVYELIDYCKFNMNGVIYFNHPSKTNNIFATVGVSYVPTTGHKFVLILENLVCEVDVFSTDTILEILQRMRDKIIEVTPFNATVEISGILFDAFGNPISVEIDTNIGSILLIGTETPYFSNTGLIESPVVGSSVARVSLTANAINVNHYYYSSRAGRRPFIPLRSGTSVSFTAPSDSQVKVYTRLNKDLVSTEALIATLTEGELFTQTFTKEHVLIFEYVSDSDMDAVVNIDYPSYDGTAYGLRVKSVGVAGDFSVQNTSGDLHTYVTLDHTIQLSIPDVKSLSKADDDKILRKSVSIRKATTNTIVYTDNGDGYLLDSSGVIKNSGSINYATGLITLPYDMPYDSYYVQYDQNGFDNFAVDSFTVPQLIEPKSSFTGTVDTLSTIILR